jgi:hypothetical protein
MTNNEIDPWDKEELSAVRHAGTVYAGAVAVVAVLHEAHSNLLSDSGIELKIGVALLLIGIIGSVFYQLITIQYRAKKLTTLRYIMAVCVVLGAFGFGFLALYVMTL